MKIDYMKIINSLSSNLSKMPACKPYKAILIVFLFLAVILCGINFYKSYRVHQGESCNYMLLTIAIRNHGTDEIRASDIDDAKRIFPGYRWNKWQLVDGTCLPKKINDIYYAYYAPTYSTLVVPFLEVFERFGRGADLSWQFFNLVIIFISSGLAFCWLRKETKYAIYLPLIVLLSPSILYIRWASAEISILSFLSIGLSALFTKRYKTAVFCIGLSSTLNASILGFLPFVYFKYFLSCKGNNDVSTYSGFIASLKNKPSNTFSFIGLSLIGLAPLLINYIRFGTIVVMQNASDLSGVFGRMYAYIFDLNFGLFPYFPILIILFSIPIFKRDNLEYLLFIFSVATVFFGFSLMFHINSGMETVSRYNAWFFVFLIFGAVSYLKNFGFGKFIDTGFFLSVILLSISTLITTFAHPHRTSFQSAARVILDYTPGLYNPLPSTFSSRVNGLDGGYDFAKRLPIVYETDVGFIRKILFNPRTAQKFLELNKLVLSQEKYEEIQKKIEEGRDYFYVNFYGEVKYFTELFKSWMASDLPKTETAVLQKGLVFSKSNIKALMTYGPYVNLGAGTYILSINYTGSLDFSENVGAWDIVTDLGNKVIDRGLLKGSANNPHVYEREFTLAKKDKNLEFRVYSSGSGLILLQSISLRRKLDINLLNIPH